MEGEKENVLVCVGVRTHSQDCVCEVCVRSWEKKAKDRAMKAKGCETNNKAGLGLSFKLIKRTKNNIFAPDIPFKSLFSPLATVN